MKVLVTEKLSEHKYKTPEGYLICVDAVLARTGKQSYMRSELFDTDDETEVDVDRRPEEVFSPQTLASFENKPITKNHPDEDVNSENIKEYSVGFVRDVHKGYDNGQPVILGTLVIQDEETIKEIENGEYTQLSCGYNCDVVDEENPQQKCIRGNHIALCEQGRAGNARIVDSKMKKDSNLTEVVKFLKQNLFNFDVYYDKINFDSTEEMRNAIELLKIYNYKYRIYNSNSIIVEDSKMRDSIKDELYTLEELRKMRIGNYKEIDIYRVDGKFSTNPNTSKERFDTFEEVKRYIDNGFRDSIKDELFEEYNANREIKDATNSEIINAINNFKRLYPNWENVRKKIWEKDRVIKKEIKNLESQQKNEPKRYVLGYTGYFREKSSTDKAIDKLNKELQQLYESQEYKNIFLEYNKLKSELLRLLPQDRELYSKLDEYFPANPSKLLPLVTYLNKILKELSNKKDSIKDVEPRADEDKDEFISRFMRETKEEYPDEKQRLAVAYSYWDKKSTKDEESTYTEVTKELEKDYNNFTKDSKLTLDKIINIYKALKKNNR